MEDNNSSKIDNIFGIIGIVFICIFIFSCCNGSEQDHDDGKCDVCGKSATYSSAEEEYCDEHLQKAVEWYISNW